jgi:excisionase family DNA binding protein
MDQFFTTFEVAALCQVYHTTVINWINKGQLKAYTTPGRHRRIQRNDLLEFMHRFNVHIPRELNDQKKKILAIDDDKSVLKVLEKAFSKLAPSVHLQTTTNGVEALVMVGKDIPDLIILDIIMPGMDGIQICRSLRANPETESIKIMAITGKNLTEEQETFLQRNVEAVFSKPFSPMKLIEKTSALLKLEEISHEPQRHLQRNHHPG